MKNSAQPIAIQARFYFLTAIALVLTLATGALYGRWTNRWGASADLEAAGRRLETLPSQIGDWRLVEERPLAPLIQETLQCSGFVNRVYAHRSSGDAVNLALIVGPAGPTSVHTPEICYSSRAYDIEQPPMAVSLSRSRDPLDATDTFWTMTFRSNNVGREKLRVYYAWSAGAQWVASGSPRFEFGGRDLLYKLEISSQLEQSAQTSLDDPCKSFLEALAATNWSLRDATTPVP